MMGANGSSTGGAGKGREDGEEADPESKKLRNALAGAIFRISRMLSGRMLQVLRGRRRH